MIGNADKEGAEEVKDVSLFSSSLKNASYFISGTSLHGQKLYSIESAIPAKKNRVKLESMRAKKGCGRNEFLSACCSHFARQSICVEVLAKICSDFVQKAPSLLCLRRGWPKAGFPNFY